MSEALLVITSLIFFFLGRYTRSFKPFSKDPLDESIEVIIEKAKQSVTPHPKIKPGIIPFKTPEEFEAERNGDKALDEHWKQSGMREVLK